MTLLTQLALSVCLQSGGAPGGAGSSAMLTPAPPNHRDASVINPQGPLKRANGRLNRFTMSVTIFQPPLKTPSGPWTLPLIVEGPWSTVDPSQFEISLSTANGRISSAAADMVTSPTPLGNAMLEADVPQINAYPVTFAVQGVVATWSSVFDDAAGLRLDWPAQWPAAVQSQLRPSLLIESDSDIITSTVTRVTQGDVRSVPPLQAAKLLVQFTCDNFQPNGPRMLRGMQRQLRGIAVAGAESAAESGTGSRADLVCLCVAMLRAAGLPARPVIGIAPDQGKERGEFSVWAEVFLPQCGWVPFDPYELKKRSVQTFDARQAWRYFGNVPDLDRHIPLSWSFAPGNGATAWDAWALWGWARLAPGAEFPLTLDHRMINTDDGPLTLQDANVVPSQVNLQRSSLGLSQPPTNVSPQQP